MFIFLSVVHPVQMFDGDDWTYISFARNALPNIHEWNPARIFPEILMPAVGFVAAYVVTPILGNYLLFVSVTCAFVIALVVTTYIAAFSRMLSKLYHLKMLQKMSLALLFFVAHFWLFRSATENNIHLFLSRNLTCYFYYTIPTLLCAILILFMVTKPDIWHSFSGIGKGVFLLLLYFLKFIFLHCYCCIFRCSVAPACMDKTLKRKKRQKCSFILQRKLSLYRYSSCVDNFYGI